MTIFKYVRMFLLSLYWQLPQAKGIDLRGQTEISKSFNRIKEKQKKLKKKRQKLPLVQRKTSVHQQYKQTKPKSLRFSDQRKLRRMYRGV